MLQWDSRRHFLADGTLVLETGVVLDGSNAGVAFAGGITVNATGQLVINGATITHCKAYQSGAVNMAGSSNMTMSAGKIEYCEAAQGGGVYINSAAANVGFELSGTATIANCLSAGVPTPQGGGVYVRSGSFWMTGTSEILNCTASGSGQGGGIYITEDGLAEIGNSSGTASPKIIGCIAHYAIDFNASPPGGWEGIGGGIYSDGGSLTLYDGMLIKDCHASNNGGGIFTVGAPLTMLGGTIEDCTASNGGGVFAKDFAFNMSGGTIRKCRGYYQGGGIASAGSVVTMKAGAVVDRCTAGLQNIPVYWSCKGGGIFLYDIAGTRLKMENGSTISNCSAYTPLQGLDTLFGSGGGIYVESNATAELSGANIINCSADHHGGGIFTKDYQNVTTDNQVVFSGNKAAFYRIPGDKVLQGIYPCSNAQAISLSASELDNRKYPLNNYDINYLSYLVAYYGNGGTDSALTPATEYKTYIELTPFKTSETMNNAEVYTVLSNDRSSNGNLFEYTKSGSEFAAFSNYNTYAPHHQYFYTYGPTQAYDPYPYSPARPTQPTSTLNVGDLLHQTNLPKLEFQALWTKNLTIAKEVLGNYGDKTKVFTITLTIRNSYWDVLPELGKTYHFKDGDSDTIRVYDDTRITVEEDGSTAHGYIITYNDGGGSVSALDNKPLTDYTQLNITATVENTRIDPAVPTGISEVVGVGGAVVIGLLGIASQSAYMVHKRRRNQSGRSDERRFGK